MKEFLVARFLCVDLSSTYGQGVQVIFEYLDVLICKKLLLIFAVIYLVDTDGNISRRHMFIPGFALYCSLLVQFLNKKMRCVSLNLTSCLFFVSDKTSCND